MEDAIKDILRPYKIFIMRLVRPVQAFPYRLAARAGYFLSPMILKIAPDSIKDQFKDYPFRPVKKKGFIFSLYVSALTAEFMNKNEGERARLNRDMWAGNKGKVWIEGDENRRDLKFLLSTKAALIEFIDKEVNSKDPYVAFCEIGTGDGRFLEYLSSRFSQIKHLIGIDLNAGQMNENNAKYSDKNLHFLVGQTEQILDEIEQIVGQGRILFITSRTLTLFTQMELENLLQKLSKARLGQVAFALYEQNAMDLSNNYDSVSRGSIQFYSHNYPHLFKKHGWTIQNQRIDYNVRIFNDYSITLLATI